MNAPDTTTTTTKELGYDHLPGERGRRQPRRHFERRTVT